MKKNYTNKAYFTLLYIYMAHLPFHSYQIKSNLFAIRSVHNITIHKFALRLAGQTGDNFALMSANDN